MTLNADGHLVVVTEGYFTKDTHVFRWSDSQTEALYIFRRHPSVPFIAVWFNSGGFVASLAGCKYYMDAVFKER